MTQERMNDPFYGSAYGSTMELKGLRCTLHMPKALERKEVGGIEVAQSLPPYNPRAAFSVEEYPGCPDNWMRSSPDAASYFVPIVPGYGMWLDFNYNQSNHSRHVAAVVSIQGVNAITGLKTDKVTLEQYKNNCPRHDKPFGGERFCEDCRYKWDAQNYLASNATPHDMFWLDGFRAKDGEVRQFIFTEETMRGVAAQILGEERVFALGIAFFLSKEQKSQTKYSIRYRGWHEEVVASVHTLGAARSASLGARGIEVGAGAKISQRIYPDPENLDFWQDVPAGVIYINYVNVEEAQEILAAGKRDLTNKGEGFMGNLRVGNP